eukprot:3818412-Rhodomonas_salina.1
MLRRNAPSSARQHVGPGFCYDIDESAGASDSIACKTPPTRWKARIKQSEQHLSPFCYDEPPPRLQKPAAPAMQKLAISQVAESPPRLEKTAAPAMQKLATLQVAEEHASAPLADKKRPYNDCGPGDTNGQDLQDREELETVLTSLPSELLEKVAKIDQAMAKLKNRQANPTSQRNLQRTAGDCRPSLTRFFLLYTTESLTVVDGIERVLQSEEDCGAFAETVHFVVDGLRDAKLDERCFIDALKLVSNLSLSTLGCKLVLARLLTNTSVFPNLVRATENGNKIAVASLALLLLRCLRNEEGRKFIAAEGSDASRQICHLICRLLTRAEQVSAGAGTSIHLLESLRHVISSRLPETFTFEEAQRLLERGVGPDETPSLSNERKKCWDAFLVAFSD